MIAQAVSCVQPRMKHLAVLAVIGVAACGGRAGRHDSGGGSRSTALADLEATADQAYERALARDSSAVVAASTEVLDGWTEVRRQLDRSGAEADDLTEMDLAVLAFGKVARESADPIVVARAANRVTGALGELDRAGTLAIVYLGRELALDGMTSDLRHAGAHVSLLIDEWHALSPELAAPLDDAVSAADAAVTARDVGALVTRANELVELARDQRSGSP